MSRLNIAICRIALSVGLLAAVVTAQAQNICSNGEQRCRSDGHIENCIGGLMWSKSPQLCGESKQKITVEKTVTTQEICTEGDQKCGPRGYVLQCEKRVYPEHATYWRETGFQCK